MIDHENIKYQNIKSLLSKGEYDRFTMDVRDIFVTLRPTHFPNPTNPHPVELAEILCADIVESIFTLLMVNLLSESAEHLREIGVNAYEETLLVKVEPIEVDAFTRSWSFSTSGDVRMKISFRSIDGYTVELLSAGEDSSMLMAEVVYAPQTVVNILDYFIEYLTEPLNMIINKYAPKMPEAVNVSICPPKGESEIKEVIDLLEQALAAAKNLLSE